MNRTAEVSTHGVAATFLALPPDFFLGPPPALALGVAATAVTALCPAGSPALTPGGICRGMQARWG